LAALSLILVAGMAGAGTLVATSQPGGGDANGEGEMAGPPPTPVRVDVVRRESVRDMRRTTGEIAARRRAIVASKESGLVLAVAVDEGERVDRGAVLARLDPELLELEHAEAEARLGEAQARVAEEAARVARWERELQSLVDLAARDAAQPKQLADARDDLAIAQAQRRVAEHAVAVTQAQLNRLERRISRMTITAPFDGMIVTKQTEVGEWVNEGGAVVEMIERGLADAVLEVPERIVNLIEHGMTVEVTLATGKHLSGHVRAIVPEADPRARTYPVKVELLDDEGRLKPGMSLSAFLPTGEEAEAITVPKDAIVESPTGSFVYVVRGASAVPATVEVLAGASANRAVVSSASLRSGDEVVIEGNERLHPGATVDVINRAELAPAGGSPTGRSAEVVGPGGRAPQAS
ncbi:MAG: efflux RND transporter periplasmic adaptor subunit, partial [Planctomycetota bacterium]